MNLNWKDYYYSLDTFGCSKICKALDQIRLLLSLESLGALLDWGGSLLPSIWRQAVAACFEWLVAIFKINLAVVFLCCCFVLSDGHLVGVSLFQLVELNYLFHQPWYCRRARGNLESPGRACEKANPRENQCYLGQITVLKIACGYFEAAFVRSWFASLFFRNW